MPIDKSKVKIPEVCPVDLNSLPMKLPKIEIDRTKCRVPFWCKKCLENCPHLVFWVDNVRIERFKEADPRQPDVYKLMAVRRDKCTLCSICVDGCPEGAITITHGDTVLKGKKTMDTVETAARSPYDLIVAPSNYSFELNEDMLNILHREFDPDKAVDEFIAAVKKSDKERAAAQIFGDYGAGLMLRAAALGEEYSDRTYEVLKQIIDDTGEGYFPHVPQRIIEIAYLATQKFLQLPVLENYPRRLLYQVPGCYIYSQVKEKGGENLAATMSCRHACLNGLDSLFKKLDLEVEIRMTASTAKEGHCEFSISKK